MNGAKLFGLILLLIPIGCAAPTELHRGRAALLTGMPDTAATHFGEAAAINERLRYSQLGEGILTYLGRAYYDAKKYPQARQSLDRALAADRYDGFARLYLGLTLARQGNSDGGRKEVLGGLETLSNQLNGIVYYAANGYYWDTTGQLRRELTAAHRAVTEAKPNLDKLFVRLEDLGIAMEREIDFAAKDETIQLNRKFGDQ